MAWRTRPMNISPTVTPKRGRCRALVRAGAALVDTIQQGAQTRHIELNKPFDGLGRAKDTAGRVQLSTGQGHSTSNIHIENLTVQADDVQDMLSFVRMLQLAGSSAGAGVAL